MSCGYGDPMTLVWCTPYDTEFSALRRIHEGGGLVALWSDGMEHAGIPEVCGEAARGDIAIIHRATLCGGDQALGIFTGQRWVTLALAGIEAGPATVVKAWRP